MLCALTVRKLKPGSFEQFLENFRPDTGGAPTGWVSFRALRNVEDENQVITFGFFDGTLEELHASQEQHNYRGRVDNTSQFVESVETSGVYDVVVDSQP
jgi:heme-degrading monooxygenase HmoA